MVHELPDGDEAHDEDKERLLVDGLRMWECVLSRDSTCGVHCSSSLVRYVPREEHKVSGP